MVEWLITWGASKAVGFLAKKVIGELAQGAAEDYVKDFFKQCFSNAISNINKKEPLQKAMAAATKDFLELVEEELKEVDGDESQLDQYIKPLEQLIKNQSVLAILGSAFDKNVTLDIKKLATIGNQINPSLPDKFDWELVIKQYQRKAKKIIRESDELRQILDSENLEELASQIQRKPEFNLRKHQEGIRERYGNLRLDSLDTKGLAYNIELLKMFIPQKVRETQEFIPQIHLMPKEHQQQLKETRELETEISQEQLESLERQYFEQQTRSVLELVEDNKYQYLVILGDPGSGKSTLLRYIAIDWAELSPKDLPLHPIPILIELQTYMGNYNEKNCENFLDFLEKGSGVICNIPQQELHDKLEKGEAIVMFDGLDEVFDPAKRERVITDIHRFTNDYKNVRVIVTSRVIGYKPQRLRDAKFHHFMLQDLDEEQIDNFITRWHELTYKSEEEETKKWRMGRLVQAIKGFSAIKEIARNPLLLTMMAIMNRNQELPKYKADLYQNSSELLLKWDVERALRREGIEQINLDSIEIKDKQEILRRMANFMQENKEGKSGNLISENDVERIIKEYLDFLGFKDAIIIARALVKELRNRNFILCSVGGGYYAFVHRAFLEYFCAWSFAWKFKETQSLNIDELINDVFGSHWRDEKWHEILRLIAGMIHPNFVKKILSYLIEKDGEEEKFMNLFLAGKCLFEVAHPQHIDEIASELLNRLKALTNYNLDNIDYDSEIRTQAVTVVAETWRNNRLTKTEIKTWLNHLAESHNDLNVRERAREELAIGWKND
jgi:predicted NACHT family NTPase